jgi:hypothetical protein
VRLDHAYTGAVAMLLWTPITISLFYMCAWITHWTELLTLIPGSSAMVFNTGLCLLLLSLNAFSFDKEGLHWFRQLWIIPLFLAVLTGFQYLGNLELGFDEFFAPAFLRSFRSHPGRMAPITSFCLALLSIAWGTRVNFSRESHNLIWCSSLIACTLVLLLGTLSLAESLFSIRENLSWGSYAKISAASALCFVLLGTFGWIEMRKRLPHLKQAPRLRWTLHMIKLGLFVTLIAWQYRSYKASIEISRALDNEIQNRYSQFYQAFQYRAEELQKLSSPKSIAAIANPSWSPPFPSIQAVIRFKPKPEIAWNRSSFSSIQDLAIFESEFHEKKKDFVFYPTLFFQRQRFMGFLFQDILWVFSPEVVTNYFFPADQYTYTLKLKDDVLMTNESGIPSILHSWKVDLPLRLWDDQLNLDVTPTKATLDRLESPTPRQTLLIGLALTALLATACAYYPWERRQRFSR